MFARHKKEKEKKEEELRNWNSRDSNFNIEWKKCYDNYFASLSVRIPPISDCVKEEYVKKKKDKKICLQEESTCALPKMEKTREMCLMLLACHTASTTYVVMRSQEEPVTKRHNTGRRFLITTFTKQGRTDQISWLLIILK